MRGSLTIWGLRQASLHKLMFSWQQYEWALQIQDVVFAYLFLPTRQSLMCFYFLFSTDKGLFFINSWRKMVDFNHQRNTLTFHHPSESLEGQ